MQASCPCAAVAPCLESPVRCAKLGRPPPRGASESMPAKKPPAADVAAGSGWSGRFAEPVSDRVKRYTASVAFDRRLADADITGSLAHARMLAAAGIVTKQDLADIERGLRAIRAEIAAGSFSWSLDHED